MRLIPTTATAVEKLRREARSISRQAGVPYTAALDLAAQRAGYENWRHVKWCLESQRAPARAPVVDDWTLPVLAEAHMEALARERSSLVAHPPRGRIFHDVEIGGRRFKGWISDGGEPVLIGYSSRPHRYAMGSVPIGAGSIHYTAGRHFPGTTPSGRQQWSVCKYGSGEPRFPADDLSPSQRRALAYEFGLHFPLAHGEASFDPLAQLDLEREVEFLLFYRSPAFQGLCEWVAAHPRMAKACPPSNHHLGDWLDAATKGKYEPPAWLRRAPMASHRPNGFA
jgi:hypothetical protein